MRETATQQSQKRGDGNPKQRNAAPDLWKRDTPKGRRRSGTYRTTVYRLNGVKPDPSGLQRALDQRYLRDQDFEITQTTVADTPALLVHGHVPRDRADWCPILTGLTGNNID